jgi:hypothetical protein
MNTISLERCRRGLIEAGPAWFDRLKPMALNMKELVSNVAALSNDSRNIKFG